MQKPKYSKLLQSKRFESANDLTQWVNKNIDVEQIVSISYVNDGWVLIYWKWCRELEKIALVNARIQEEIVGIREEIENIG